MSQAIERVEGQATETPKPITRPPVDIYETEDALFLYADLPGVHKDSLTLHIQDGELTIEGARTEHFTEDVSLLTEFQPANFHRSFSIHEKIDAEHIEAQLQDGVLEIRLPKSPALKPRKIDIH